MTIYGEIKMGITGMGTRRHDTVNASIEIVMVVFYNDMLEETYDSGVDTLIIVSGVEVAY